MGDNRYKDYISQLQKEYLSTFERVELYINGSVKLDDKEKNNCLLQVLDSFLSAQTEGRAVETITGKSLKNYCDNMIYGEAMYIHKASRICRAVFSAFIYIFFMEFLLDFSNQQ